MFGEDFNMGINVMSTLPNHYIYVISLLIVAHYSDLPFTNICKSYHVQTYPCGFDIKNK